MVSKTTSWRFVFDMDGVLVDSEVHWKQVEAEFLGGLVPGWSAADQRSILGMSAVDVHRKLVAEHGETLSVEEYFGYYAGLAEKIYGERSSLIAGSDSAVRSLFELGIPLALCSSSPHEWIRIVLERFDLARYFSVVVSSSDVKGKGKPAPDIYRLVLEQLGANGEEAAAIEDSSKGVASAKGAGLFCFGFRNGFNHDQPLEEADDVLEGFEGLDGPLLVRRAETAASRKTRV